MRRLAKESKHVCLTYLHAGSDNTLTDSHGIVVVLQRCASVCVCVCVCVYYGKRKKKCKNRGKMKRKRNRKKKEEKLNK